MTHRQVYGLFRDIFPNNYNADTVYFPNGKNSIRLRGTVDCIATEWTTCLLMWTQNDGDSKRLISLSID